VRVSILLGLNDSRYHVVQEFNKGIYDYIIATDESGGRGEGDENENEEPVTQEAPDVVPPSKESEFVDTARQDEATSDEEDGNSPDEEGNCA
jgi:ATP-dependent RNA helicase DDX56/DBP9